MTPTLEERQVAAHNLVEHWQEIIDQLGGAKNLIEHALGSTDDVKIYSPVPYGLVDALERTLIDVKSHINVADRALREAIQAKVDLS
jgi:hypothetical protein